MTKTVLGLVITIALVIVATIFLMRAYRPRPEPLESRMDRKMFEAINHGSSLMVVTASAGPPTLNVSLQQSPLVNLSDVCRERGRRVAVYYHHAPADSYFLVIDGSGQVVCKQAGHFAFGYN